MLQDLLPRWQTRVQTKGSRAEASLEGATKWVARGDETAPSTVTEGKDPLRVGGAKLPPHAPRRTPRPSHTSWRLLQPARLHRCSCRQHGMQGPLQGLQPATLHALQRCLRPRKAIKRLSTPKPACNASYLHAARDRGSPLPARTWIAVRRVRSALKCQFEGRLLEAPRGAARTEAHEARRPQTTCLALPGQLACTPAGCVRAAAGR